MTKCSMCGHDDQFQSSNLMTGVSLDIPMEMVLPVLAAIRLGRNTSLASSNDRTMDGFVRLRKALEASIPEAIRGLDENRWLLVCERIRAGHTFQAKVFEEREFGSYGNVVGHYAAIVNADDEIVLRNGRYGPKATDLTTAQRHAEEIQDLFDQMTPLDAAAPAAK